MEAKHSMGEWKIGRTYQSDRDKVFYHTEIISGGIRIAVVAGVGKEMAIANAKLMTAAPALKKALQLLVNQKNVEQAKQALKEAGQ